MDPLADILTDFEPLRVLELGRDRRGRAWSQSPALVEASVVDRADRQHGARQSEKLGSELEQLDSPLDLVIDHATDDAEVTMGFIEVVFGRLAPDGRYVVDGSLPSEVVIELMLATVVSPDVIASVTLTSSRLVLQRGPRVPSTDRLRLSDLYSDPLGIIT
jgi:hypothetical protein